MPANIVKMRLHSDSLVSQLLSVMLSFYENMNMAIMTLMGSKCFLASFLHRKLTFSSFRFLSYVKFISRRKSMPCCRSQQEIVSIYQQIEETYRHYKQHLRVFKAFRWTL